MKKLIVFSLFVLFHLGAWGAAHGWLSMNKKQTLVVVDTSYSMKPHFNNMEQWIENLRDGARYTCLLYTSPSPRDRQKSRMPSSA